MLGTQCTVYPYMHPAGLLAPLQSAIPKKLIYIYIKETYNVAHQKCYSFNLNIILLHSLDFE